MKHNTSSHYVMLEKVVLDSIEVEAGDEVFITVERVNDDKVLKKLAAKKLDESEVQNSDDGLRAIFGKPNKLKTKPEVATT